MSFISKALLDLARHSSPRCKAHDTWVVEDFLEFGNGF
jgi:hypothetical protein